LDCLSDVDLRTAWSHEALEFTPWLAKNLDQLGEVLGVTFELDRTEARVGAFAADILARDSRNDSAVVIENQIAASYHSHLGQILTYLSGLDAKTVIWVAGSFRDEHLPALRWLNEHTDDAFAFFAVRVRVVLIGQSPFAPIFDVLERPNGWDRRLHEMARGPEILTPVALRRRAFWAHYVRRFPDSAADAAAGGGVSRWRAVPELGLVVSRWVGDKDVRLFVRGIRGQDRTAVMPRLAAYGAELSPQLGANLEDPKFPLIKRLGIDVPDETEWDRAADWLHSETDGYVNGLKRVIRQEMAPMTETDELGF
jgi:hypothetical protein